ncbi:uncharacterized protein LOC122535398 isoform X2 [Frieseomelitta varia]|uniref:uncharacterized protein LOC122535398 isoform X2 n=1 Tax=Frieseomelitta varia TaxID=561572 RepID=UPI001CB68F53|nr:uncharacterized protein LOC122535398 isoform X2 [Frieseomelitta varia]
MVWLMLTPLLRHLRLVIEIHEFHFHPMLEIEIKEKLVPYVQYNGCRNRKYVQDYGIRTPVEQCHMNDNDCRIIIIQVLVLRDAQFRQTQGK